MHNNNISSSVVMAMTVKRLDLQKRMTFKISKEFLFYGVIIPNSTTNNKMFIKQVEKFIMHQNQLVLITTETLRCC